jgi:hypothetical protein
MKDIRSHPIVLVTLFSAIVSLQAEAASDADYKEKILGQWKQEFVQGPASMKGLETYNRDGTLIADGMLSLQGQKTPIKLSGVWEIKNGTLIATLKKSNVPQMMPVGTVSKDKIVEINETVFRYKTEDGELERKTRVPNSGIVTAETSKSTDHAMRLWTDSTGKFKIEATLKELKKGPPLQPYQAVLQKSDGSRVQIPLNRLSAADQDYLRRSSSTNKVTPKESPKPIAPATPAAPEIIKATSNPKEQTAIIEEAILKALKKPGGKVTDADWMKVTNMNLSSTEFSDAGLKELSKAENLTGLYASRTRVTNAGIKELAAFKYLHTFNAFDTQISDAGLKELAAMKKLKRLYLGNTKITDAGLRELAALPQLNTIILEGSEITDAGLDELAKFEQLIMVGVMRTKVTKAAVEKFKKALPKCRIHSNF